MAVHPPVTAYLLFSQPDAAAQTDRLALLSAVNDAPGAAAWGVADTSDAGLVMTSGALRLTLTMARGQLPDEVLHGALHAPILTLLPGGRAALAQRHRAYLALRLEGATDLAGALLRFDRAVRALCAATAPDLVLADGAAMLLTPDDIAARATDVLPLWPVLHPLPVTHAGADGALGMVLLHSAPLCGATLALEPGGLLPAHLIAAGMALLSDHVTGTRPLTDRAILPLGQDTAHIRRAGPPDAPQWRVAIGRAPDPDTLLIPFAGFTTDTGHARPRPALLAGLLRMILTPKLLILAVAIAGYIGITDFIDDMVQAQNDRLRSHLNMPPPVTATLLPEG